jgi:hypothetical protein
MRTRRWLVGATGILFAVVAGEAHAVEIAGKWGIGAGVFSGGGEMSLMRGISDRTAWTFDLQIKQSDIEIADTSLFGTDRSIWSVTAGPGLRRFVRQDNDLAAYWGLAVDGIFSRFRFGDASGSTTQIQEGLGVAGRFDLGAEYATPWHFSVAAHSTVASLSWSRIKVQIQNASGTTHALGHEQTFSFGLNPALFARVYF